MVRPFRRHLLILIAVLVLAVGSAVSAAMMAPDRGDLAEAQLAMMGMTSEDLCGDHAGHGEHGGHDHRCPFCHLVSDPAMPAPADIASRLIPVTAWQLAGDLHRAAQARDHARSPRAPPLSV